MDFEHLIPNRIEPPVNSITEAVEYFENLRGRLTDASEKFAASFEDLKAADGPKNINRLLAEAAGDAEQESLIKMLIAAQGLASKPNFGDLRIAMEPGESSSVSQFAHSVLGTDTPTELIYEKKETKGNCSYEVRWVQLDVGTRILCDGFRAQHLYELFEKSTRENA